MQGRTVLVTGASSGIGAATARQLCVEGASVMLAGRDESRLRRLSGELEATGAATAWIAGDVADPSHGAALVAACVERLGALDGLAACAGEFVAAGTLETGVEVWDRQLAVNAGGTFFVARAAISHMRDRRVAGALALVGSVAGRVGESGVTAYGASKFAVAGLVAHLAAESAAAGVRVNGVAPGTTLTEPVRSLPAAVAERRREAHPLGRLAEPEEIARPICFLLSEEGSFLAGVMLPVDGGLTAC